MDEGYDDEELNKVVVRESLDDGSGGSRGQCEGWASRRHGGRRREAGGASVLERSGPDEGPAPK